MGALEDRIEPDVPRGNAAGARALQEVDPTPPIGPEPKTRFEWGRVEKREALGWLVATLFVVAILFFAFRRMATRAPTEPPVPVPGSRIAPPPLPDEVPPSGPHGPASEPANPQPGAP